MHKLSNQANWFNRVNFANTNLSKS